MKRFNRANRTRTRRALKTAKPKGGDKCVANYAITPPMETAGGNDAKHFPRAEEKQGCYFDGDYLVITDPVYVAHCRTLTPEAMERERDTFRAVVTASAQITQREPVEWEALRAQINRTNPAKTELVIGILREGADKVTAIVHEGGTDHAN